MCCCSNSKIDGLVAIAMALGCMSADDLLQPTSPGDDSDFKLAVYPSVGRLKIQLISKLPINPKATIIAIVMPKLE